MNMAEPVWQHARAAFFESVAEWLGRQLTSCKTEREKLSGALPGIQGRASALTQAVSERQNALGGMQERLQRTVGALRTLQQLWHSVAGPGRPWSEGELVSVKSEHDRSMELRGVAHRQLETARSIRDSMRASELIVAQRRRLGRISHEWQEVASLGERASTVKQQIDDAVRNHSREQIESLMAVVSPLFMRLQANRVIDSIHTGENPLDWLGQAGEHDFDPAKHFSQGQRQDLALAIFLARARTLGGTFFLDEPLAHLDDLNRLALLDALRVLVVEATSQLNLVITTANKPLVKHLIQKFARVESRVNDIPPLRVYELQGNPRVGVEVCEVPR